jgi:hypothetical protein
MRQRQRDWHDAHRKTSQAQQVCFQAHLELPVALCNAWRAEGDAAKHATQGKGRKAERSAFTSTGLSRTKENGVTCKDCIILEVLNGDLRTHLIIAV